jgi:hypothetical protein
LGGWSVVASGITGTEHTFGSGNPESEGTWTYRVTESNASAPSAPSLASEAVKVDKSGPNPPIASADSDAPASAPDALDRASRTGASSRLDANGAPRGAPFVVCVTRVALRAMAVGRPQR